MSRLEVESFQARLWFKCEPGREDEMMDFFQEIIEREAGMKVHVELAPEDDESDDGQE